MTGGCAARRLAEVHVRLAGCAGRRMAAGGSEANETRGAAGGWRDMTGGCAARRESR
ncbi:MAG: hypothetical protein LBU97_02410 [Alistipes sp.]|nr:hypothetical protein [Alistipes sp.]